MESRKRENVEKFLLNKKCNYRFLKTLYKETDSKSHYNWNWIFFFQLLLHFIASTRVYTHTYTFRYTIKASIEFYLGKRYKPILFILQLTSEYKGLNTSSECYHNKVRNTNTHNVSVIEFSNWPDRTMYLFAILHNRDGCCSGPWPS